MENKEHVSLAKIQQVLKLLNEISELFKSLHLPYNYRVLKDAEIKSIINQDDVKQEKTSRKPMLTKDQLEEFLKSGMRVVEIANKLGCTQSYISLLKKKYGFETRKYRKGDK